VARALARGSGAVVSDDDGLGAYVSGASILQARPSRVAASSLSTATAPGPVGTASSSLQPRAKGSVADFFAQQAEPGMMQSVLRSRVLAETGTSNAKKRKWMDFVIHYSIGDWK